MIMTSSPILTHPRSAWALQITTENHQVYLAFWETWKTKIREKNRSFVQAACRLSMLSAPWFWFPALSFPTSHLLLAHCLFLQSLATSSVNVGAQCPPSTAWGLLLSLFCGSFMSGSLSYILAVCCGPGHVSPDSFPFPPPPTMDSHLILLCTHAFAPFDIISRPTF